MSNLQRRARLLMLGEQNKKRRKRAKASSPFSAMEQSYNNILVKWVNLYKEGLYYE